MATKNRTKLQKESHCHVVGHPVVQHKLSMLRDESTTPAAFRLMLEEISEFLAYEVTKDLKTSLIKVQTPMAKADGELISEKIILIPIMRAGSGMLEGMLRILPFAAVGHVGIYRDKFIKNTVEYYFRLPKNAKGKRVIMLDPLLATGDTACAAIDRLKQYEVGPIQYVCLLAAPQGLKKVQILHPDVEIYTLSIEKGLDKNGYILPGLGDAGDRLFGTV